MLQRALRTLVLLVIATAFAISRADAADRPLELRDAIDLALRTAPAVASAGANSDLNDARARESAAALLPAIRSDLEYSQSPGYDVVVTNRGQSSAQLILDYTAIDFGRRLVESRAVRYQSEAAALGVSAARAQIVFDTTVAFFDLDRARRAQTELEGSLDRMNRYVAIVEALEKSGRAIANDVLRIRAARNDAEFVLSSARSARRRASIVLALLIGEPADAGLDIADSGVLPVIAAGDISSAPALKAAERDVAAASTARRAAELEPFPTLAIELTAGALGVDPQTAVTQHGGASYTGLISVPIFQGGAIAARIDQARALERAAKAQAAQVRLDLARQFADAAARYGEDRDALGILARAQPTADDGFALSWARFLGGGNITILEVLDSYQQAERLRLERFDREFALRQDAAQAALALGIDR